MVLLDINYWADYRGVIFGYVPYCDPATYEWCYEDGIYMPL